LFRVGVDVVTAVGDHDLFDIFEYGQSVVSIWKFEGALSAAHVQDRCLDGLP
jgi:hypothetical protein